MKKQKLNSGISLVEILMVVLVFAMLGILITSSVFLTLRGTNKSSSTIKVRENVNYILSVINRQFRNSQSITECPNPDFSRIDYLNVDGVSSYFQCNVVEDVAGYIASGSARLNSEEINITECSFECVEGDIGNPPSVIVKISAEDSLPQPMQKGRISTETEIILRTY